MILAGCKYQMNVLCANDVNIHVTAGSEGNAANGIINRSSDEKRPFHIASRALVTGDVRQSCPACK